MYKIHFFVEGKYYECRILHSSTTGRDLRVHAGQPLHLAEEEAKSSGDYMTCPEVSDIDANPSPLISLLHGLCHG